MVLVRKQQGFSLIELVIVLGILGLVFTGGLTGISSFQHSSNTKESQNNLAFIKKQTLNFGVINKFLPCPDTDGDGFENRTTQTGTLGSVERCTANLGGVPYLDLGLQESDANDGWSNAIRYAVNTDTTNANLICDKTSAASMFCNSGSSMGIFWFTATDTPPFAADRGTGNYYICNDSATSCSGTPSDSNLESDSAAVVLVAYNEDGATTLASCGSATGANAENCDTDAYYHQKTLSVAEGAFFDDVITSISGYEVKSKLLSGVIAWNSYTSSSSTSGLTPTVEIFDVTQAEIDAGNVPTSNSNSPDVILVNRDVSADLDLQNGDDYIAIGNNLNSGATLDAGNGDDAVYIVGSALGTVSLGSGDDQFVLGTDLTNVLDAGSGNDKIWIQGNINSGSTLNLGSDNDVLWVGNTADSTSGNIKEIIDGGSGTDILVLENFASATAWTTSSSYLSTNITNIEYVIFADDSYGNRQYCQWGGSGTDACP
ncbi:type II secretion system protein [Thiomicrorhabdus sp. Milos-T2]|uniref:type II secretion system protein n=1 Tax=Thiomicrorhabdus sp. Milos-T2 TaxID=90814 RepID=UPI000571349F|nr:type II secretion system protein [Thiomicrorhabdus sp. Milos-T2]